MKFSDSLPFSGVVPCGEVYSQSTVMPGPNLSIFEISFGKSPSALDKMAGQGHWHSSQMILSIVFPSRIEFADLNFFCMN